MICFMSIVQISRVAILRSCSFLYMVRFPSYLSSLLFVILEELLFE